MKATPSLRTALLVLAVGVSNVTAQTFTNSRTVLDGSGCWVSGGSDSNISAAGQPGGVLVSTNGNLVNLAGFLNAFVLRCGCDADCDGLPDELELDNDGDGLNDVAELTGSAFQPTAPTNPNDPDSDHDGFTDAEEAAAGTDPTGSNALLRITSVQKTGGSVIVGWLARSNKTYRVKNDVTLAGGSVLTSLVATVTADGPGPAPWYPTTHYYTDTNAPATNAFFYRIEVIAP